MEKKYDWKAPNRLLVVQTGESVNQPEVFRAHAVHQGLSGNLINALKLLANQQEDGDGRNFIQVDNHRALEVGYLKEGLISFMVRKQKKQKGTQKCLSKKAPTN